MATSDKPSAPSSAGASPTRSRPDRKSDEFRERPVREKLRETSIQEGQTASAHQVTSTSDENRHTTADDDSTNRGRVRRKRSFEELVNEDTGDKEAGNAPKHVRKRSRDSVEETITVDANSELPGEKHVAPTDLQNNEAAETQKSAPERPSTPPLKPASVATAAAEKALSPANKRTRDQFETSPSVLSAGPDAETKPTINKLTSSEAAGETAKERERKRAKDDVSGEGSTEPETPAKIPPSSGFANASAQSPFSALSGGGPSAKSPQGGFAASGFASFAANATSPFGTMSPSKPAIEKPAPNGAAKGPATGFGGLASSGEKLSSFASASAAGASPFSSQSGFGSLGGNFSSKSTFGGNTFGPPLSSFSSSTNGNANGLSSKSAKPFGTPVGEEEDGEVDEDDTNSEAPGADIEDGPKDSRFFEQNLETGEEGEETVYQCRAKLYCSTNKEWKERGIGNFKVNVAKPSSETESSEAKTTARFIMRAQGSQRMVLNSPLTKEVEFKDRLGGTSLSQTVTFMGFLDNKPTLCLLKVKNAAIAEELNSAVNDIKKDL